MALRMGTRTALAMPHRPREATPAPLCPSSVRGWVQRSQYGTRLPSGRRTDDRMVWGSDKGAALRLRWHVDSPQHVRLHCSPVCLPQLHSMANHRLLCWRRAGVPLPSQQQSKSRMAKSICGRNPVGWSGSYVAVFPRNLTHSYLGVSFNC